MTRMPCIFWVRVLHSVDLIFVHVFREKELLLVELLLYHSYYSLLMMLIVGRLVYHKLIVRG